MERDVDLAPRHLFDWLTAELARDPAALEVRATRAFVAEEGPASGEDLDAEDEVGVVTTVGEIEVTPRPGGCHWRLRLRVEDPFGDHLPDEGSVPDDPEEIGLDDFAAAFLADAEPEGSVTVETPSRADARAFDRLLARILADSHGRG
jgi:hypothetical protein